MPGRDSSNRGIEAETAYLFRHAVLRDAAYQLQMPADRARLHALALEIIEMHCGGRPDLPSLGVESTAEIRPHATDEWAIELARHAELARPTDDGSFLNAQRTYTARGAVLARRTFRNRDAAQLWHAVAQLCEGVERGEALRRAATAAIEAGLLEEAIKYAGASLEAAQNTGSLQLQAAAMAAQSNCMFSKGEAAAAREKVSETLRLREQLRDQRGVQIALGSLGQAAALMADYAAALEFMNKAIAMGNHLNEARICGTLAHNLAQLHQQMGRLPQAEELYNRALEFHREHGLKRLEGISLGSLGTLYRQTRRLPLAKATLQSAITIHVETGNRLSELRTFSNLALVLIELEEWEEAEAVLKSNIAIAAESALESERALAMGHLGNLYTRIGRLEEGEAAFVDALDSHRRTGDKRFLGLNLCDFATTLVSLRRPERAIEVWREGEAILLSLKLGSLLEAKVSAVRSACETAGVEAWL